MGTWGSGELNSLSKATQQVRTSRAPVTNSPQCARHPAVETGKTMTWHLRCRAALRTAFLDCTWTHPRAGTPGQLGCDQLWSLPCTFLREWASSSCLCPTLTWAVTKLPNVVPPCLTSLNAAPTATDTKQPCGGPSGLHRGPSGPTQHPHLLPSACQHHPCLGHTILTDKPMLWLHYQPHSHP